MDIDMMLMSLKFVEHKLFGSYDKSGRHLTLEIYSNGSWGVALSMSTYEAMLAVGADRSLESVDELLGLKNSHIERFPMAVEEWFKYHGFSLEITRCAIIVEHTK